MQGMQCGSKMVSLTPAMPRAPDGGPLAIEYSENFVDSSGCTLFIQSLGEVYRTEEALRGYFTQFGEVALIKILE